MDRKFPVLITSYEIVLADAAHLGRLHWKYLIVDEGHRLKNFECKLLRELRQFKVDNKLLLSGACSGSRFVMGASPGLFLVAGSPRLSTPIMPLKQFVCNSTAVLGE